MKRDTKLPAWYRRFTGERGSARAWFIDRDLAFWIERGFCKERLDPEALRDAELFTTAVGRL